MYLIVECFDISPQYVLLAPTKTGRAAALLEPNQSPDSTRRPSKAHFPPSPLFPSYPPANLFPSSYTLLLSVSLVQSTKLYSDHHDFSTYVASHCHMRHRSPMFGSVANNQVEQIRTTVTDLLKINHPVLLAGMNVAAGPKLAAAVTNAGGLGVIGGVGYTPDMLREQIAELKSFLKDKNAPFGVDLLLPQVGGSARKTK